MNVDNPNLWKMDKMGQLMSPLEVVKNGSRNLHAVNSGVYYTGSDGGVRLETLDAPLLSPDGKRLLQFDNSFAPWMEACTLICTIMCGERTIQCGLKTMPNSDSLLS
ncbi:hypothetical protein J2Z65_007192 [Paenibacillus aceris]|uniref:Strictosidine synthase conserved region domain-containing protein n=1 Tax=Paenibacillus aceris TaxID=869555 RepID=A0ABS4IAD8_9BACL|nr:hypothetical protein [Paenibacillus aceris]